MKLLKLKCPKGNNGIKNEDLKIFLNDSRLKLKKIASMEAIGKEIQEELTQIHKEFYEINESIPSSENVIENHTIIERIVKTSERMENLKEIKDDESKSVISSIISGFLPFKQHFQSKAVPAIC